MRTLISLTFAMAFALPAAAQSFTHPCEVIYYEINKRENTSGYTMDDFLTCKKEFGTTRLIDRAEEYKKSVTDRVDEVARRQAEMVEVARGERSGKIVQSFDLRGISRHPENTMRMPFASYVDDRSNNRSKVYETPAELVCKKLGYEKAISSSQSPLISAGDLNELKNHPERILELRKKRFASQNNPNRNPIVHSFNSESHRGNPLILFRYFTAITCERTLAEGEQVQDFELDIEAIRRQVERDVEAPELDDDVRAILSIGNTQSSTLDKRVDDTDRNTRDDHWEPNIDRDDFFIFQERGSAAQN